MIAIFLSYHETKACLSGTSVNVGGAGCKSYSVSGETNPCVNSIHNYSVNFTQYQQITWTVTPGKGRIIAINGRSIQSVLSQNNLPANNLYGVIISTNYNAITFDVDVFIGNETFKAGGAIDVSKIPGIRNLLTDFDGNSIVVEWYRPGASSVVSSASSVASNTAGNLVTCYSQTSDSRSVWIRGADLNDNTLALNSNSTNVLCTSGLTVALNKWVDNATYSWSFVGPGQVFYSPGNTNSVWINGFERAGTYTFNLDMRDICGNLKRVSRTINVSVPDFELRIGGQINNNPVLNCSQVDFGFEMSAEPWISSSATYTWTLPAGWAISNRTPTTTTVVDGLPQFTYSGLNLRYTTVRRVESNAINGPLTVRLDHCNGSTSRQIMLTNPSAIVWNVPSRVTSCQSEFDFQANITGGTPPFTYNWESRTAGGTFQNNQTLVPSNSFKANAYGVYRFQLSARDANGCGVSRTQEIFVTGAVNSGQENQISGWLSGRVDPQQRVTLSSNFAWDNDNNRLYCVASVSREIGYYQFVNNAWRFISGVEFTNNFTGDVPLFLFKTGNTRNIMFYLDGNRGVRYFVIEPSTGLKPQSNPNSIPLSGIVTSGDFYAFKAIQETETIFRLIWKESNGSLRTQVFEYLANGQLNPVGPVFSLFNASVSGFAINAVRYEVDVKNRKIFYFLSNGGFYYLKYDDLEAGFVNPVLINNLNQFNTMPEQVTSVEFDNEGSVYYAANGDIYFAEFNANNNVSGFYKIETTEAVGLDLPSAATGNFTINQNSNVVYYISQSNNVFQLFRKPNFSTAKVFGVVKATPYLFNDFASQHPVFVSNSGGTHLFYRNTFSDLSDLSYTDAFIGCRPRWVREDEPVAQKEVSGTETFELKAKNIGTIATKSSNWLLYPNPANDVLQLQDMNPKSKNASYKIIDLSGALKISGKLDGFEANAIEIGGLPSGMYLIQIIQESGESSTQSFVVSK